MTAEDKLIQSIEHLAKDNPAGMTAISELLNAGGERGVLLWLCSQTAAPCAVDIIEHFSLSAGRVANILKTLEKQGCVERTPDEHDRRVMRIKVTEKGRTRAAEDFRKIEKHWSQLIHKLGEKDAAEMVYLLSRALEKQ
ncbi:MAG: MarR family winged helix-turn-helix transcriptional regulator [Solobacterium sp.]|nr:MarR family winged helix-turn-helix transcriptional regulator [Solobacterium sp.]